ncbi:hypothetical protein [Methanosarcina horonobensis]|uniref:hypothetical protein n=1 Tax=Methanosarcina horonobensis TaxID=418008 RepID=UPI00064FD077|nr:hypothetical protein [Methanosarcina horonobensis]
MTSAIPEDRVRLLVSISGIAFVERMIDAKDSPIAIPKCLPVFAIIEAIAALPLCSPLYLNIVWTL